MFRRTAVRSKLGQGRTVHNAWLTRAGTSKDSVDQIALLSLKVMESWLSAVSGIRVQQSGARLAALIGPTAEP